MQQILTAIAIAALAFQANASTLGYNGDTFNPPASLPDNFSLDFTYGDNGTRIAAGEPVLRDAKKGLNAADFSGLTSTPTELKFTYLGKEASYSNRLEWSDGSVVFNTDTSMVGDSWNVEWPGNGVLDFSFCTDGKRGKNPGCFGNRGTADRDGLHMAISDIIRMDGTESVLLFFGDGFGDSDFDDMVIAVNAIGEVGAPLPPMPLPAGLLLLPAGLGLLMVMRRRTRT